MYKVVDIVWFIFIGVEFFVSIITFYYLSKEYKKALAECKEENRRQGKKYFVVQGAVNKRKVKLNMTERIDVEEINKELECVTFKFNNGTTLKIKKIVGNRIRIGRDPRNDIKIEDVTVSRKQCIIEIRDGEYILHNFSNRNVTRINGQKVKQSKEIKDGDTVEMGNMKFVFTDVS